MNRKIDWNHALDAMGGSIDLLLEIIEIFFEEYPKLMAAIKSSLESGADVELRRAAHTLKGSLRFFGDIRASQLSEDLELMARDGQLERVTDVLGELQTEMDEVVSELEAFVASQSPETDA